MLWTTSVALSVSRSFSATPTGSLTSEVPEGGAGRAGCGEGGGRAARTGTGAIAAVNGGGRTAAGWWTAGGATIGGGATGSGGGGVSTGEGLIVGGSAAAGGSGAIGDSDWDSAAGGGSAWHRPAGLLDAAGRHGDRLGVGQSPGRQGHDRGAGLQAQNSPEDGSATGLPSTWRTARGFRELGSACTNSPTLGWLELKV